MRNLGIVACLALCSLSEPAGSTSMTFREMTLYFTQGSSDIPPQYRVVLDEAATFIRQTDSGIVIVAGCSNPDETATHPELAARRRVSVADELVKLGVNPEIMSVGDEHNDWLCSEYRDDVRLTRRAVIAIDPSPRMRR